MVNKVRVYGKAQNRTALGIVHAYMVMYPHATFTDLQKAFPNKLAAATNFSEIFVCADDKSISKEIYNAWYFHKEDELLTMGDGTKVAMVTMWTKDSFKSIVDHAKQYGIEVAEFKKGQKFQKGGYRLEYLNGYVPPVPVATKKKTPWLWIAIAAVILIAVLILCMRGCNNSSDVKVVEKTVVVHDTLYVKQIEEIERNFNAAEFDLGKAELSESAKSVLRDLAKLMKKDTKLRLRLEGHCSVEGSAALNQKLSKDRAQAAIDFLVNSEGIDGSRLEAVGYGSSQLKNKDNPNAPENRRTEFIIVE
jgi:outer membrane protein OmpA-like peptidoglycan-associated protein